eukprot:Rmarinus@m.27401
MSPTRESDPYAVGPDPGDVLREVEVATDHRVNQERLQARLSAQARERSLARVFAGLEKTEPLQDETSLACPRSARDLSAVEDTVVLEKVAERRADLAQKVHRQRKKRAHDTAAAHKRDERLKKIWESELERKRSERESMHRTLTESRRRDTPAAPAGVDPVLFASANRGKSGVSVSSNTKRCAQCEAELRDCDSIIQGLYDSSSRTRSRKLSPKEMAETALAVLKARRQEPATCTHGHTRDHDER